MLVSRGLLLSGILLIVSASSCYDDESGMVVDTSDCPNNCCVSDVCGTKRECGAALASGMVTFFLIAAVCSAGCAVAYCYRRRRMATTTTIVHTQHQQPFIPYAQPVAYPPPQAYPPAYAPPPGGAPQGYYPPPSYPPPQAAQGFPAYPAAPPSAPPHPADREMHCERQCSPAPSSEGSETPRPSSYCENVNSAPIY